METGHITPKDITQLFPDFYHTTANQCTPPTPLVIQDTQNNTQAYNLPLTLMELVDAINRTGNTAPEPDKLHYHFNKHLGTKGKHIKKLVPSSHHPHSKTGKKKQGHVK